MPNSPRKNCPTLTIAIYHLKPWTWVLTQFWTFEIISINKKVTAFQTKVVFSFFDISSKLPGWILGTLRGPKKKNFFFVDLYGNELQHTKFWAKSVTMLSKKCNTWHETTHIEIKIYRWTYVSQQAMAHVSNSPRYFLISASVEFGPT